MKERRIKSIYYKLISMGCDIFTDDNKNEFFVSRHSCANCKSPWYMNLTECFLCGMLNSYLFYCNTCDVYSSTTGGTVTCNKCRNKRKKICFNDKCISNKNGFKKEFNDKKNGVMDKSSPSSISQSHCINCGSSINLYLTSLVAVKEIENTKDLKISSNDKRYDCIIFVKKNTKKYLLTSPLIKKVKFDKFVDSIELEKIFS